MTMFRRGFKNNVKNEMMRNERLVENFKIMIEMTIDLNDKLYERVMKKRYSKRHFERKKNYVNHRAYKIRFETSRNKKRSNGTIFIKLNGVLLTKSKKKKKKSIKKKKKKKRRATHVVRKATMSEIANRRTLFDSNSTLY